MEKIRKSLLSVFVLAIAWLGVVATSKRIDMEPDLVDDYIASELGKRWKISKVLINNDPTKPEDCLVNMELMFKRDFTSGLRTVQTDSSRKKCNPNSNNRTLNWEPLNPLAFRILDGTTSRNFHVHTNFGDSLVLFDTTANNVIKFMHLKAQ